MSGPTRVVWERWQSERDGPMQPDEAQLRQQGLQLVSDGGAELRILVVEGAQDLGALDAGNPCPTLLICSTRQTEERALAVARSCDEVIGAAGQTPASLALRLGHMNRRRLAFGEVSRRAVFDSLTGVFNRAHFHGVASAWIGELSPNEACGLLLLDLDHFKRINDERGHHVGDAVLVAIARRIEQFMLRSDLLARLGGEEFVVLARRPDDDSLDDLAEEIRLGIEQAPMETSFGPIPVTASIGFTRLYRGITLDSAMQEADGALYAAKAAGRNRVVHFAKLVAEADARDADIELMHFQNVSRVVNERSANLVATFGSSLVRKARQLANVDRLTAVWNRGYFDRRLTREIELSRKDGRPLAIAVMDLDHFGRFNREHGLPAGEAGLKRFGEVAVASIRPSDWFARYGGEEFVLVMPATAAEAAAVAERVRLALQAMPIESPRDGVPLFVTVSIGVAQFHASMAGPIALVQAASDALRQAKQAGRNVLKVA